MSIHSEVEFVHPVSAGGSVKFVASSVNFSIFTNFFALLSLKLGEIDGVEILAGKSGGVKFWANLMSDPDNKAILLLIAHNDNYQLLKIIIIQDTITHLFLPCFEQLHLLTSDHGELT